MMIKRYVSFETRGGWIGLLDSGQGLVRSTLPQKSDDLAREALGKSVQQAVYSSEYFQELISAFQAYFEGCKIDFKVNLDFSQASDFDIAVWKATCSISYGTTHSYAWVARQIGKPLAARAVGHALGKNPLPLIVPCHRVIGSDGKLHGFGGGLDMKQYLLDLETGKSIR